MADIVTGTVSGQVDMTQIQNALSDIRREQSNLANTTITSIGMASADLSKQVDAIDDTLSAALTTVARDTADLKSQVTAVGYQVRDGFFAAAKDAEINALKTQVQMAQQTTFLADKISGDGEKTRALVASLNESDLNRQLIERSAALLEERGHGRYWQGQYGNGQFAALSSQVNALNSQMTETRQGMVNFGTMAGVGQSTTANSVR